MPVTMKQTQQEMISNCVAAFAAFAKYKVEHTRDNEVLLAKWLLNNKVRDNVIDASLSNMKEGLAALVKAGVIKGELQKKAIEKPKHDANEVVKVAERDALKELTAVQKAADESAIKEAIGICQRHSNFPHSRAEKERNALIGELGKQQQLYALGKVSGEQVLKAITDLRDSFGS